LIKHEEEWTKEWDEEFKKCALRVLFKATPTLERHYCQIQKGRETRGIGIHVRTGEEAGGGGGGFGGGGGRGGGNNGS